MKPALGGHGLALRMTSQRSWGTRSLYRGLTSGRRIVLTREPDARLRLPAQVFRCPLVCPGALGRIARWQARSCVKT